MDKVKSIGIMTGNSLDAVDVVLSEIDIKTNEVKQLHAVSYYLPAEISDGIRKVRLLLKKNSYNIEKLIADPDCNLTQVHNAYMRRVIETVNALISEAVNKNIVQKEDIDIIGFHGQTLGHFPPSIADGKDSYTVQMGDGQYLADALKIPVVYDFRSDDIINGGEGAPMAPVYDYHIVKQKPEMDSVAFCNAGNTGNITIVSKNTKTGKTEILGWDTGPFNHFPDYLMRTEQDNEPYDIDGVLGKKGSLDMKLLSSMFAESAVTRSGENFLLAKPPKSSDPSWYKVVKELEPKYGIPFVDRLRTAEFYSAYTFAYSLVMIPENIKVPSTYILCGGGWKNPIISEDFRNLLTGRGVYMPQHLSTIKKLSKRWDKDNLKILSADYFGISSKFMEANVFADMAVCRLTGTPYTLPATTGAKEPTVCGVIRYPEESTSATERIKAIVKKYKTEKLTRDEGFVDTKLNRAVKGWKKRIKQ